MKTRRICLLIAASAWPVPGASGVMAAWGQKPDSSYVDQPRRLDVDFPGGKLSDYITAIRKARPEGTANIVVMPDAKSLDVPPISLVGVTVEAAVGLLEGPYALSDGRRAHVDVNAYRLGESPDSVFKIDAQYEVNSVQSAVWSLERAMAGGQSVEELLGAVDAVLSLFSQKADITFHPPTRLLIARGTDEQLGLVREAIERLIENAEERKERITGLSEQIDELEGEIQDITAMMGVAEKQVSVAKTRLDQIRKAVQVNEARPEELAEAELETQRAEAHRRIQAERHRRLSERLAALEASLAELQLPPQ